MDTLRTCQLTSATNSFNILLTVWSEGRRLSFSRFCCHRSLQKFRHSPVKKTHILKLLVTKANPFYASEETVLATNPIDVLEKEKNGFTCRGTLLF